MIWCDKTCYDAVQHERERERDATALYELIRYWVTLCTQAYDTTGHHAIR